MQLSIYLGIRVCSLKDIFKKPALSRHSDWFVLISGTSKPPLSFEVDALAEKNLARWCLDSE